MMSFLSDWWEAFVISGCYEMGDPLARAKARGTGMGELARLSRSKAGFVTP
jgi:hypothetical protein